MEASGAVAVVVVARDADVGANGVEVEDAQGLAEGHNSGICYDAGDESGDGGDAGVGEVEGGGGGGDGEETAEGY